MCIATTYIISLVCVLYYYSTSHLQLPPVNDNKKKKTRYEFCMLHGMEVTGKKQLRQIKPKFKKRRKSSMLTIM